MGERPIDWGKTSQDYAIYRPGYPDSFWQRLTALEIGLPGQRVLDLGCGTGVMARPFAARGCEVVGVDIAEPQVEAARRLADEAGLEIDLRVGPAEEADVPEGSIDVVSSSQSWHYFDKSRAIPLVKRVLAPGGVLLISHNCWLPRLDVIACTTEELVLKHNPQWPSADFDGRIPAVPAWAEGHFELKGMFWYDERLPFTRESWRGRLRACRGVGASLNPEARDRFDKELAGILEVVTPGDEFTVLHRIDAHVLAAPEP